MPCIIYEQHIIYTTINIYNSLGRTSSSMTAAYKYCYINPRQRGSEQRALLEYAVGVCRADVQRGEAVAGTKYEQRLELLAWHNTYIFHEVGNFAVNVKKNSANYRLQRGDRLTPKDGGGDCVGIMRLFKQGEDCPCTRTLQYKSKGPHSK